MKAQIESRTKKVVFTTAALLLPVLLLLLLEGGLRLFNYGGDLRLVQTVRLYGQKYYQLNPRVGQRYFRSKQLAVPELYPEIFAYNKPANLYRIFIMGGSTTAGFPFEMNARFTNFIEAQLNELFAGKTTFEVVNVGMSAINSFSVLDFMSELVHYQPDLFIIYMGHNEFYGALGVGSTETLGKNRNLILLYLRLNQIRTFRLLRDFLFAVRNLTIHADSAKSETTLMENVVQNRAICFDSPEYRLAQEFYRQNLTDIINLAQQNSARVLLSTLVCNLKDQPPFVANFAATTSPEARQRWSELVQKAKEKLCHDDFAAAVELLEQAIRSDDNQAEAYYLLGQAHAHLAQYKAARAAYRAAADRDELRFRASSDCNRLIHEIAIAQKLPVVEMEETYAAHSSQGLIGNELIYEHLHPNLSGYALMAQAFCTALRENNVLLDKNSWPSLISLNVEDCRRLTNVTAADLALADWRIRKLTSHWPFTKTTDWSRLQPQNWLDSLAVAYLQKKIPWSEVHYRAARHYEVADQTQLAIAEYSAIAYIRPDAYYPRLRIGSLYLAAKQPAQALPFLQGAEKINPQSPFVEYQLGTTYLIEGKIEVAAQAFERALALDSARSELKPAELARVHYAASLALVQLGRSQQAIPHLEWVAANQPQLLAAGELLAKLKRGERVAVELSKDSQ